MKQMSSSLSNMFFILTFIAVVAGGALGYFYQITKGAIEKAERDKQIEALNAVLPLHDNIPPDESYRVTLRPGKKDSLTLTLYPAKMKGQLVGTAIETLSRRGYMGEIKVMVGLNPDGSIYNYKVIRHEETPGLGSKMADWFRSKQGKRSVIGRDPGTERMTVSKDGGDVDAITAATITSRAFLDAIRNAYKAYMQQQETIAEMQSPSVASTDTIQAKPDLPTEKKNTSATPVATKKKQIPVDAVTDATTSASDVPQKEAPSKNTTPKEDDNEVKEVDHE